MKFDKAKRTRDPQPAIPVQDQSTNDGPMKDESDLDNPAEVNTTPDITPFKPKRAEG